MARPFIAARVPEVIDEKLRERVESTGSSRTDIVISALAQYLGCSIEVPVETNAVDRLAALEKRVEALERNAGELLPADLSLVISDDTDSDNEMLTNKQMAELTGRKQKSVGESHRLGRFIKHNGKQYKPLGEGRESRWWLADNRIN